MRTADSSAALARSATTGEIPPRTPSCCEVAGFAEGSEVQLRALTPLGLTTPTLADVVRHGGRSSVAQAPCGPAAERARTGCAVSPMKCGIWGSFTVFEDEETVPLRVADDATVFRPSDSARCEHLGRRFGAPPLDACPRTPPFNQKGARPGWLPGVPLKLAGDAAVQTADALPPASTPFEGPDAVDPLEGGLGLSARPGCHAAVEITTRPSPTAPCARLHPRNPTQSRRSDVERETGNRRAGAKRRHVPEAGGGHPRNEGRRRIRCEDFGFSTPSVARIQGETPEVVAPFRRRP